MSRTICLVLINHPEFKLLNLCLLHAFTDKSACAQCVQICISNPAGHRSGFQFSTDSHKCGRWCGERGWQWPAQRQSNSKTVVKTSLHSSELFQMSRCGGVGGFDNCFCLSEGDLYCFNKSYETEKLVCACFPTVTETVYLLIPSSSLHVHVYKIATSNMIIL